MVRKINIMLLAIVMMKIETNLYIMHIAGTYNTLR